MMAHITQFNGTFPDAKVADAALVVLQKLERMMASRPIVGGAELPRAVAGCELGCERCYWACALVPHRIDMWEAELDRAGGVPLYALKQDGIAGEGR